jgi:sugar lactone lactonase YvrE
MGADMASRVDAVVRAGNILGEDPLRSPSSGRLLWTDIEGRMLFALYPAGWTGAVPLPAHVRRLPGRD